MKITSTKDVRTQGLKFLIYGPSGSGKTTLIKTAVNPIIISSESGLLALSDVDIPVIEVTTEAQLEEAYQYALIGKYDTICIDSISDIAESILGEFKIKFIDGRQAYGKTNDIISRYIRLFRDIKGKNVYITAKEIKVEVNKVVLMQPMMPGATMTTNMPYYFDLVMRLEANRKGERMLHTSASFTQVCKDRSNKLDKVEPAHLANIIEKVLT